MLQFTLKHGSEKLDLNIKFDNKKQTKLIYSEVSEHVDFNIPLDA